MRYLVLSLYLITSVSFITAQTYSDSISVNFFLLDECRISQNISGEINYVQDQFGTLPFLYFRAYFPGESVDTIKMHAFMSDYKLEIPYFADREGEKVSFYGASVAPEVVVYDEREKVVLYKGRIDNSYADVGIRRRVVTSKDLRKVLQYILDNAEIPVKETKAIGCYLNH